MWLFRSKTIWCSLFVSVALIGLMRGEPGKESPANRIKALVGQLGDARFRNRELASVELKKFGEQALPALRQAATASGDLEVRLRAEEIISTILLAARTSKTTGLEMVVIKAGTFQMGSPKTERVRQSDELQHRVQITQPFLLGKREVSQEQYRKVMNTNPSWFAKTGAGIQKILGQKTSRFPVENVSWYDAVRFCNRLSKLDGYNPYYKLEKVRREGDSIAKAKVTFAGGNGYRLPTEAEWEYACRAWTTNRFHYGASTKKTNANLKSVYRRGGYGIRSSWQSLDRTTTVGSYAANPWGLHDMHGNVTEWCWDYYDKDYYARSPAKDPQGPTSRDHRVLRGGSWLVFENNCRSASRFWMAPGRRSFSTGFRVARTP